MRNFAYHVPTEVVFGAGAVTQTAALVRKYGGSCVLVLYGGGSAVFAFERRGDSVRIVVKSANDFQPPEESACSPVYEERGRGLFLVDAVSENRLYSKEEGISVTVRITL